MSQAEKTEKSFAKQATEKLFAALNRADELGGELRDFMTDRVAVDPRYVKARKTVARLLGKKFESKQEVEVKVARREEQKAAVAARSDSGPAAKGPKTLGDPSIKAQIYGKKSCPWSGRAITLFEKHKVDYDFVDLEEPEHESKALALSAETKQNTVPYVYLRGHFIGGFNALSEIERLGQLEGALMSAEERAAAPAHIKNVVIVSRPNTDEVAPAEVGAEVE
jgi:glutaredoxin